jgi:hypothetical protein
MATERQLQLEQAFRQALRELGASVSTEFLIAAASERTQADAAEIIKAVEVVNRKREGPDEGTDASDEVTTLRLSLGKAVTAIWSNLPQNVQHELFEQAVSAQDNATRERLALEYPEPSSPRLFRWPRPVWHSMPWSRGATPERWCWRPNQTHHTSRSPLLALRVSAIPCPSGRFKKPLSGRVCLHSRSPVGPGLSRTSSR